MLILIGLVVGLVLAIMCERFTKPWGSLVRYGVAIAGIAWIIRVTDQHLSERATGQHYAFVGSVLAVLFVVHWLVERIGRGAKKRGT